MLNFKERLSLIKAFAFDVDGVFTDGNLILLPNGEFVKTVNTRDAYAIQLAVKLGYPTAIISSGKNSTVENYLKKLGVAHFYMGSTCKRSDFTKFTNEQNIDPDTVLYMGDDIPDYEAIQLAGIRTCPSNADPEIKKHAHYISNLSGGKGCVRDVIEQTLRAQGQWPVK